MTGVVSMMASFLQVLALGVGSMLGSMGVGQQVEIVNSWNLFIYFSREVLRTIEFVQPVTLSPGLFKNRFQNGPFKN